MNTTARPKRRLEKSIEAEIIKNLKAIGFGVTKTSQPRPSMLTRGIPDLYAAHPTWGLRVWIEVKAEDNKPSAYQLAWHATERAAGGTVLVAWSWGEVQAALQALGAPIR